MAEDQNGNIYNRIEVLPFGADKSWWKMKDNYINFVLQSTLQSFTKIS